MEITQETTFALWTLHQGLYIGAIPQTPILSSSRRQHFGSRNNSRLSSFNNSSHCKHTTSLSPDKFLDLNIHTHERKWRLEKSVIQAIRRRQQYATIIDHQARYVSQCHTKNFLWRERSGIACEPSFIRLRCLDLAADAAHRCVLFWVSEKGDWNIALGFAHVVAACICILSHQSRYPFRDIGLKIGQGDFGLVYSGTFSSKSGLMALISTAN